MRKALRPLRVVLLAALLLSPGARAGAVDIAEFETLLTSTGVVVEMHGANPALDLFAITYRSARSFFDFEQMSLVVRDAALLERLRGMQRHDRIRITGRFLPNPSAQRHVLASTIELVEEYRPGVATPDYHYAPGLLQELRGRRSATFLVHIAEREEGILVVEYRDAVLPVFLTDKRLIATLSRNDLIELRYTLQEYPDRPPHLRVDEEGNEPIRVLDAIGRKHGLPADVSGALVLFPRSPQIVENVFAVLEELPGGVNRQYTLVNLENPERFAAIREKLQAAWDRQAPADYVNGRNKLVSRTVRVRVRGTFNQTDPGQANPQILLESADALTIVERN